MEKYRGRQFREAKLAKKKNKQKKEEQEKDTLRKKEEFLKTTEGKLYNKIISIIMEFIGETYEGCSECGIVYPQNEYENEKNMYDKIHEAIINKEEINGEKTKKEGTRLST